MGSPLEATACMKRLMASADDDNVKMTVISPCAELEFLTKMLA